MTGLVAVRMEARRAAARSDGACRIMELIVANDDDETFGS